MSLKKQSLYEDGIAIFAINSPGRGTDIKLNEIAKNNGGMHAILTFLLDNTRIKRSFNRNNSKSWN